MNQTTERPRVLVTGASGMLGSEIARKLHEQGFEVIGTSRSKRTSTDQITWKQIGTEEQRTDPEYYRDLIQEEGIQYIVDSAGMFGGDLNDMHLANRDAPIALAKGAEMSGQIERYIRISSYNQTGYKGNTIWDDYAAVGIELEKLDNLNWTVVEPTHVYNTKPDGAHVPYHVYAASALAVHLVPDQPMQPIHLDDLSEGVVILLQNDNGKHEFIPATGPERFGHNKFMDLVSDGLQLPKRRIAGFTIGDPNLELGPKNALRLASINELLIKYNRSPIPAFTQSCMEFNLLQSTDNRHRFAQATGLKMRGIQDRFSEDRDILLEDIKRFSGFITATRLLQPITWLAGKLTSIANRVIPPKALCPWVEPSDLENEALDNEVTDSFEDEAIIYTEERAAPTLE